MKPFWRIHTVWRLPSLGIGLTLGERWDEGPREWGVDIDFGPWLITIGLRKENYA